MRKWGDGAATGLIHRLIVLLGDLTRAQLVKQIEFLKAENLILRSKLPSHIPLTARERHRLIELGKALGPAIKELITIVSPRTFTRWVQGDKKCKPGKKISRLPTPVDVQALILQLGRENRLGYTRILGELKKLKINVSRSTVVNILRDAGIDPGPNRGKGSWSEFVKTHSQTLWACSFISRRIWTRTGLIDCHLLFFVHLETRKVIASPVTLHPTDAGWFSKQRTSR